MADTGGVGAVGGKHVRGVAAEAKEGGPAIALLFDADGTLLQSLEPHVRFLHAEALKRGLPLSLWPADLAKQRSLAAAPMSEFIKRAGFVGDELVAEVVAEYEANFAAEYPVHSFPGIDSLLNGGLPPTALPCIITSNTTANVKAGLGPELSAVFADRVWGLDNSTSRDKAVVIAAVITALGFERALGKAVYIGDTEKDCRAALKAGVSFIGVNYGFESLDHLADLDGVTIVDTVADLRAKLAEL